MAPPPQPANHRAGRLAGIWVRMNPRRKTHQKEEHVREGRERTVERLEEEER